MEIEMKAHKRQYTEVDIYNFIDVYKEALVF